MDRIYSINVRLLFWFQVQFAFSRSVFSPQLFPNHDDDVIVSLIESMSRCSISMLSSCCRWSLKLHGSRGGKPVQLIHSELLVLCSLPLRVYGKHLCCAYAMWTNNTIYLNRLSYYIRITSCTNRDLFIQQRIISLLVCSIEVCFLWSESGEG